MDEDAVTAPELGRMLGYSRQMLSHLAGTGAIERPAMVRGPDARWRRAWPREYVERLMADPPPALARRARRARA
jgi:hypothetical protein